jgi:hypothetical protein
MIVATSITASYRRNQYEAVFIPMACKSKCGFASAKNASKEAQQLSVPR